MTAKLKRRRKIMIFANKKVYLFICSSIEGLQKDRVSDWLKQMPEVGIIAEIEPVFVFGKNSADITTDIWIKLANEIYKRINKASGFVVIHGVGNLLYTSSILGFLLPNLTKPIIFTGSQFLKGADKDERELGFRANLINSIQAATYDFSEICIMFGNRLLRATQASQTVEKTLNVFNAPDEAILGRIDFSIRIFEKNVIKNKGKTKLYNELNKNIEIINLSPILNLKELSQKVAHKQGIIVNGGDYHKLPEDLNLLFEKLAKDTPVVIWSKSIQAQIIGPGNIFVINNMTWPTTVTKFMWAVSQKKGIKKIKELMAKDINGEIIY